MKCSLSQRLFTLVFTILASTCIPVRSNAQTIDMPYKQNGFTERSAAVHLAQRFTFGVTSSLIDDMHDQGLDVWFERQLRGKESDDSLQQKLKEFPALTMSVDEQLRIYKPAGEIFRLAKKDGRVSDTIKNLDPQGAEYKKLIDSYAKEKNYKLINELQRDLVAQKFFRAVYSRNQVHEILTDFWFNHFNVSLTNNEARGFILAYERDAIRPNILRSFRTLLGATAKHPAMLLYLNNAQSVANKGVKTIASLKLDRVRSSFPQLVHNLEKRMQADDDIDAVNQDPEIKQRKRARTGLNENYARELLELHTLGVDGGYTQKDVTEVARAFTGWTVLPQKFRERADNEKQERGRQFMERLGYVSEGDFFFQADGHDAEEKTILGQNFSANNGIDEGERVLDIVAHPTSTARFLARKVARRFVSDAPPESLIQTLAEVFLATKGDLKAMMIALVNSQEFWSRSVVNAKIKMPFEVAVSAVRAVHANLLRHNAIALKVTQMGQAQYSCVPPTGYDDKATAWVNTGALVARMNMGVQIAQNTLGGTAWSVDTFLRHHEPESTEMALQYAVERILPERDYANILPRLRKALDDQSYEAKLQEEAKKQSSSGMMSAMESDTPLLSAAQQRLEIKQALEFSKLSAPQQITSRIVGLILGSPDFQRK